MLNISIEHYRTAAAVHHLNNTANFLSMKLNWPSTIKGSKLIASQVNGAKMLGAVFAVSN